MTLTLRIIAGAFLLCGVLMYVVWLNGQQVPWEPVCPNSSYVGMCGICKGYHLGRIEIKEPFTIEYLELGNHEVKE